MVKAATTDQAVDCVQSQDFFEEDHICDAVLTRKELISELNVSLKHSQLLKLYSLHKKDFNEDISKYGAEVAAVNLIRLFELNVNILLK